ncbi:MAG: phenylalanine--tRNA ligase subunit beta [Eubacterium sp.]|nr:phenylalanine--tRNA ligase subunit beta [Eubacterium sp.]
MDTPVMWLKDIVPELPFPEVDIDENGKASLEYEGLDKAVDEFADRITLSGSHVERVNKYFKKPTGARLSRVVVGQVMEVAKHPDADRLVVCQVNVGKTLEAGQDENGIIQIVTGAPNIIKLCPYKYGEAGNATKADGSEKVYLTPTVLDGGTAVYNVHTGEDLSPKEGKIKKGKLRGVPSSGMMCAIEEIGANGDLYPGDKDGVYIFTDDEIALMDLKPGDDATAKLGLNDANIEYEITSNRVDCFSVLGMAREAAATYKVPFDPEGKFDLAKMQASVKEKEVHDEKTSDKIQVEIKDPDLCKRYIARVVRNVKIGPSPLWLQKRLRSRDINAINNIVDITNYVMEELGQPMHAFDLSTLEGGKIVVRRAQDGEEFTTLHDEELKLDTDTLMICDAVKPVALAGIKGGKNSMIPLETKELPYILFESACFEGNNIRKSERRHGVSTDSSAKFNKGLDPNLAELAITRAVQLIQEMGCGEVLEGEVDVYPSPVEAWKLPYEPEKMNGLLGLEISEDEQLDIFGRLGLSYDKASNELTIPTYRQDLHCMADLAEEIARIHGYDLIPSTVPTTNGGIGGISYRESINRIARAIVEENGFSQGMTYSFESAKVFDKLMIPEDNKLRKTIEIINPLGEDFKVMRTQLLNGLLSSLGTNASRRNKNVRLYELGNVYIPHATWPAKPVEEGKTSDLPLDELQRLAIGMYGEGDFFVMKGLIEELLDKLNIGNGASGKKNSVDFISTAEYDHTDYPFLHTLRQAKIVCSDDHSVEVGYIGQVHPVVAENYGIKADAYVAVINMDKIVEMADFDIKYTEIAKYPSSSRDLALLCDRRVYVGDIEKVIRKNAGQYLEKLELFDVYEGPNVIINKKSVAYSLTFRATDHNLTGDEVNVAVNNILDALKADGIELRA